MKTYFVDTETCGLHGVPVLLQYAVDDGDVQTVDLWLQPFQATLDLLSDMMDSRYVGFNNVFDLFHINKLWNMWYKFRNSTLLPITLIKDLAQFEPKARDGVCLIPKESIDLMLHARRGKYQSTQERKDIKIRNVPGVLADALAKELHDYVKISDIHFAKKADKKKQWHTLPTKVDGFVDIVLKFAPSTALKALVVEAGIASPDDIIKFGDISPEKKLRPIEIGYAPFAKAISRAPYWKVNYKVGRKRVREGFTWPALVEVHINWWKSHAKARLYAANDVKYTRALFDYLGKPVQTNDDILTAYVAATRWKGFSIDKDGIAAAKEAALSRVTTRVDSSSVRQELLATLGPIERAVLSAQNKTGISTNKVVLEKLAGMGNTYAKTVIDSRKALKEIELYDKLLIAGRLHASLKVGGTLSNRMAGADGLNVQAINNLKRVRALFPMADFSVRTECTGCKLCVDKETKQQSFTHGVFEFTEYPSGGDFDSFEVVIADAIYNDPNLRTDLLTCEDCGGRMEPYRLAFKCASCGGFNAKKIHALMGMSLYPGTDYAQVKRSKSTELDMYTNGKRGVFALLYGGTAFTIATKIGIPLAVAEQALNDFIRKYIKVGIARSEIATKFTALRQAGGVGTKVTYVPPAEHVENIFGFRRYFTLENLVIKRLFELSSHLPHALLQAGRKFKVTRPQFDPERLREQTGDGAVRTALLASAFGQQSANIRAAQNTEIQSSGAEATKELQVALVTIQPKGIHPWRVRAVQVHDSLLTVSASQTEVTEITTRVQGFVDKLRQRVPLLGIDWNEHVTSWAD